MTNPIGNAEGLTLISKHLQNVLDELAIITAEIEEMKLEAAEAKADEE